MTDKTKQSRSRSTKKRFDRSLEHTSMPGFPRFSRPSIVIEDSETGSRLQIANCSANKIHISEKEIQMMTKLEAIIQPGRFESVKDALTEIGVEGMTASEVRGHGRQKGHTDTYRGHEYHVDLLPKIKLEVVLHDELVDKAVEAIIRTAATGKIGDGKIFLYKVADAIRIRNQERGVAAL